MSHLPRATLALGCAVVLSVALPTSATGADWLNPDWARRMELTVKPELIAGGGPLEDFSILVKVDGDSSSSVFTHAKPDGTDIVLTSGDGVTVLDHEIVTFDPVNEVAELWFKAGALSSSDNVFYLYFDNADTTIVPTPGAAWGGHCAVYHFSDDPSLGVLTDFSGQGNSAVVGAQSTFSSGDLVSSQVGNGWNFDGTNDWTYAEGLSVADSSFTISAWYADVRVRDKGMVAMQALSGFWGISFQRSGGSPNAGLVANGDIWWEPEILDPDPHHYVWTLDAEADTARFFLDGVEQDYFIRFVPPGTVDKVYTGEVIQGRIGVAGPVFYNELDLTDGVVDEYHIAEGVRSPDWILTEYRNQSDPANFFSYNEQLKNISTAVESFAPAAVGRITVWPNPFQGRAQIDVDLGGPVHTIAVYDIAGRLVRTLRAPGGSEGLLRAHWDGRDDQGRDVGSGVYFVRAVGERSASKAKVLLMR